MTQSIFKSLDPLMLRHPLVTIDFETTGLHADRRRPIQLGLVVISRYLCKIIRRKWDIRLTNPLELLTKEFWRAKAIHQKTLRQMFFNGQSAEAVVEDLESIRRIVGDDAILAGQNAGFDQAFLNRLYELADAPYKWDYHVLDLSTLARVHLDVKSLSKIAEVLHVREGDSKHDALADAQTTADCIIALLTRIGGELRSLRETQR